MAAFPANNFGNQEPGPNEKIKQFCKSNFDVTFDLFAKVDVAGDDQCDLYKYLTDENAEHGFGGPVKWNFQKYVVNRGGEVIAKFGPQVKPEDPEVVKVIEKALEES